MREYIEEILGDLSIIFITVLFVAGIILLIVVPGNFILKTKCNQYSTISGRPIRFEFWPVGRCYVQTDSGWFLLDQVNQNNVSKNE